MPPVLRCIHFEDLASKDAKQEANMLLHNAYSWDEVELCSCSYRTPLLPEEDGEEDGEHKIVLTPPLVHTVDGEFAPLRKGIDLTVLLDIQQALKGGVSTAPASAASSQLPISEKSPVPCSCICEHCHLLSEVAAAVVTATGGRREDLEDHVQLISSRWRLAEISSGDRVTLSLDDLTCEVKVALVNLRKQSALSLASHLLLDLYSSGERGSDKRAAELVSTAHEEGNESASIEDTAKVSEPDTEELNVNTNTAKFNVKADSTALEAHKEALILAHDPEVWWRVPEDSNVDILQPNGSFFPLTASAKVSSDCSLMTFNCS
jgi:hypothetical protein